MTAWRRRAPTCWLVLGAASALAGCVVNGVRPVSDTTSGIRGDRAIVVVGVTVDGSWAYPRFGVILDQYDVKTQAITGDCFAYDRLEASVPAARAPTRFLAFDVPAGHYIYSGSNGGAFGERDHAFQALPGRAVYMGNFVLQDNGVVVLRRDLAANRPAIAQALPDLAARLELAPVTPAAPASPLLCTP